MNKLLAFLLSIALTLCLFACDEGKTPDNGESGCTSETSAPTSSEPEDTHEPITSIGARVGTFIPLGDGEFVDGYIEMNTDNTLTFHGRRFKIIDRKTVTDEEIEKINDSLLHNTEYYDEEGTSLFSWSSWGQGVGGTAPDEYRVESFEDFFTKKQEFTCGDYVAIPSYILDGNDGFMFDSELFTYTYDENSDTVTVIGCSNLTSVIFGEDTVIVSGGKTIPEFESFNGNSFKLFVEALGL